MSKNLKKVMMWLFLVATPVFMANCNAQQLADIAKNVGGGGDTCNNNSLCDTGETAQSCFSDCHCGNYTCEQNMGETNANCATDCTGTGQTAAICGNAVVENGEQCDLGNQNGMAGTPCSANCTTIVAIVPVSLTSVTVPLSATASSSISVTVSATASKTVTVFDSNWASHIATESPAASGTYIATFTAPPANGTYKINQISIQDVNGTYYFYNDGVGSNYVNGTGAYTTVPVASFTVNGGVTAAVISLNSVSLSAASVAANSMITVTVSTNANMSVSVWDSNWWSHPAMETPAGSGTYVATFVAPGVAGTYSIPEVDVYDPTAMTGVWFYDMGTAGTYWNSSTGINTNIVIPAFAVTGGTTVTPVTLTSVSAVNNAGNVTVTVSTATGKSVTVWDSNWWSYSAMETPAGSGTYVATFTTTQTVNGTYNIPEVDVYDPVAMTTTWFYDMGATLTYWNANTAVNTGVPIASYTVSTGATAITLNSVSAVNNAGNVTVTVVTNNPNQIVTVWDSNWWGYTATESPLGSGTYIATFPANAVNGTYNIPEVDVYDPVAMTTTWFYDNAMTTYYNGATYMQTAVPVASYTVSGGATAITLTSVTAMNNAGNLTVTVNATPNKTVSVWDSSNWMNYMTMESPVGSGTYTVTFPVTLSGTYKIVEVDVYDPVTMMTTWFYDTGMTNYYDGTAMVYTTVPVVSYTVTGGTVLQLNSVTVTPNPVMAMTPMTITINATPGQNVIVWDSTWWSYWATESTPGVYTVSLPAPSMAGTYKLPEIDIGTQWYWDNGSPTYIDGITGLTTTIPVASFSVTP